MTPDHLPPPTPEAAERSRRLAVRIAREIDAAGGWIGFDRFMALALYEPGLGYYACGAPVFGAAGDFVTAPELTPLFGATLARQVGAWLDLLGGDAEIVEFGAGSGVLAAQLLAALERQGVEGPRYRIVELSADLRDLQRRTIATRVPSLLKHVAWLDRLPERIDGIVIANELLDAMPVRVFARDDSNDAAHAAPSPAAGWVEAGIAIDVDDAVPAFRWQAMPADASLRAALADLDVDTACWHLPYRSEVCPQQSAWLATIAERLVRGAVLLLDYGFPAREYYHPQRVGGTLMAHYRHRAHPDPLRWPGLQDITAHVDFSRLLRAGIDAGLAPIGYLSQSRFLLNCGLLDELAAVPREQQRVWLAQTQAVHTLLSEAEMGELFKAIAFAKAIDPDEAAMPGFVAGDRSATLVATR
ncbi:MAG: class I SAM-dependent methyltransferase [Lautropia sp.]